MQGILDFVARHGGGVVFVVVFLDQLGVPIPSIPMLLAFGALAGSGRIDPVLGFLAAVAGSVAADALWFRIGRSQGARVLAVLCRISLEPDTCVLKTQGAFTRYGVKSLLFAKFVPGYDTVAPALAGILGIGARRFLAWTAAGAVVWVLAFGGLGFALAARIEGVAEAADRYGNVLGLAVVAFLVGYVAWKYAQRRGVLTGLRLARISPEELHRRIVGGETVEIVDVRHADAIDSSPFAIPGARFLTLDEIEARHHEIARDRDVVLYCT